MRVTTRPDLRPGRDSRPMRGARPRRWLGVSRARPERYRRSGGWLVS